MKIIYHGGNVHFMEIAGKNYVIPDGWEGQELEDLILIMAQNIWKEKENTKKENDTESTDDKES